VGYHASLWTTKLVRHFIYTRFGIEYCRERVRQLLHTLGFRLLRLRHRHLKAKPEEQATFVAELESLLAEWPEDCELIFVDEATIRLLARAESTRAHLEVVASRRHPQPLVCHPRRANRGHAEFLPVPRWRQRSGTATMWLQNPGIFSCITVARS
jgi:Winged helix-turn helix